MNAICENSVPKLETPRLETATYRELLKRDFHRIKKSNPAFSIRAYALKLQISHTEVAAVLAGKKNLSTRIAAKIIDRIQLSQPEREIFTLSVEFENSRSEGLKSLVAQKIQMIADETGKTVENAFDPTESRELYVIEETLEMSPEAYKRIRDLLADIRDQAKKESTATGDKYTYRLNMHFFRLKS